MGGHGRVSDERRLLAGIEEPEADVVIAGGGGGYEGHLRLRELTRDRHQGGIGLAVRVEYDGSRIAGETSASERVDLEYAQVVLRSQWWEFCTHRSVRLHFDEPWGGLERDLRRGMSTIRLTCEPVEPDPGNAGVGKRCHAHSRRNQHVPVGGRLPSADSGVHRSSEHLWGTPRGHQCVEHPNMG